MSSRLEAALTGKSLRENILHTLSRQQIQTISHFLKRQHSHDRHQHSSLHTFGQDQPNSPSLREKLYSQGYSPSPPSHLRYDCSNSSHKFHRTKRLQRSGQYQRPSHGKRSRTGQKFVDNLHEL